MVIFENVSKEYEDGTVAVKDLSLTISLKKPCRYLSMRFFL